MRVANQSASAVAFPHAPQSAKSALDYEKIEEAGPHMPFAELLGKQMQLESAQVPNQTSQTTNAARTPEVDGPAVSTGVETNLPGETQPPTDSLPSRISRMSQQPVTAAKALPEVNGRLNQDASDGRVALSALKDMPDTAVASPEAQAKATSFDHDVQAGSVKPNAKTENRKDTKGDNQAVSQLQLHIPSNAASAIANAKTEVPNVPAAVSPVSPAPAAKTETPPSPVNTPSTSATAPHLASGDASASREASVFADDNNTSSIATDGISGPNQIAEQQVLGSLPISLDPSSAVEPSPRDPSPAASQEPQQSDAAQSPEKHTQIADGAGSPNPPSQPAEFVGKVPITQHPTVHGAPAQIAPSASNGKGHDAAFNATISGPQPAMGGAQSSIVQGTENAMKPAFPSGGAANPFDKLDQYRSGDPIVLHSSAQRIAVGVPHPSLGWVEINTQSTGDRIAATLVSASEQTHQHLAAQLPSLTQYLADREVKVSSVEVHQDAMGAKDGGVSSGGNPQDRNPRSGGNRSSSDLPLVPAKISSSIGPGQTQDGQQLSYIDIHA